MASTAPPREWRKSSNGIDFIISTEYNRLDFDFINTAFASDEMYWAKPLPMETLKLMLSSSLTLGIYQITPPSEIPPPASISEPSSPRTPSPTLDSSADPIGGARHGEIWQQVGLARFITDYVSTCYLTDVYVAPTHRQHQLGKWVIACCKEVIDEMPALRRAFLVASQGVGKEFYERTLGFWDVYEEREKLAVMTKKTFGVPPGGKKEAQE